MDMLVIKVTDIKAPSFIHMNIKTLVHFFNTLYKRLNVLVLSEELTRDMYRIIEIELIVVRSVPTFSYTERESQGTFDR